jgi:hypothetical protein
LLGCLLEFLLVPLLLDLLFGLLLLVYGAGLRLVELEVDFDFCWLLLLLLSACRLVLFFLG